jgi:hypothetical protein
MIQENGSVILSKHLIEQMAQVAHEIFCEEMIRRGYRYAPITNDPLKEHNSLRPYEQLTESEKEENRRNVIDIPDKLSRIGYAIVFTGGDENPKPLPELLVNTLAEIEHERWMRSKFNEDWKQHSQTDKSLCRHKDLIDWKLLPEEEKEKDRVLVRWIPRILSKVGYRIVKMNKKKDT